MLGEAVRDEVEEALLLKTSGANPTEAKQIIEDYRRLIALAEPEVVKYQGGELVRSNHHLNRHLADVPVLLSAMDS